MIRFTSTTVGTLALLAVIFLWGKPAEPIAIASPLGFSSSSNGGTTYVEVPDAGDHTNPQSITLSGVTQIIGTIGDLDCPDVGDCYDAFKFHWSGGDFGAFASVDFLPVGGPADLLNGPFRTPAALVLFDLTPTPLAGPGNPISYSSLPPADYILELAFAAFDPPFTIGILEPGTLDPPSSIPEPSTLLLLGSTLAGFSGFAWRRNRRR